MYISCRLYHDDFTLRNGLSCCRCLPNVKQSTMSTEIKVKMRISQPVQNDEGKYTPF